MQTIIAELNQITQVLDPVKKGSNVSYTWEVDKPIRSAKGLCSCGYKVTHTKNTITISTTVNSAARFWIVRKAKVIFEDGARYTYIIKAPVIQN